MVTNDEASNKAKVEALQKVTDTEARDVLADVPFINNVPDPESARKGKKAWIHVDGSGRLSIFPEGGGWLGVKLEDLMGDIAPFAG